MDIKIENTKEAPLFSRKEIEAKITFTGATPSRSELTKDLATVAKTKPELVIIQKTQTLYGAEQANVTAHVYDNVEAVNEHEPKHILKRVPEEKKEEPKEEAKSEVTKEAKPEEKKADAPVPEEKKEEAKPEVKEEAPAKEEKPEEKKEESAPEKKGDE